MSKTTITATERAKITNAILDKNVLRGLDRSKSKGYAIAEVADALRNSGFELELVPGDILLGNKNTRRLSFYRKGMDQMGVIKNSDVVFTWEKVGGTMEAPHFEFIAYLS